MGYDYTTEEFVELQQHMVTERQDEVAIVVPEGYFECA